MGTATPNILTKMNIVPEYLAGVFYLPSSERNKKPYKPRVITEVRTNTNKEHQALYKEKEEIKSRKEKEKEDRKKAREQKQQAKLIEEENKKSKQLTKKKEESTKKSTGKQSPPKRPQTASGEKFRQNLKKLMCNESSDSEDSEDCNDRCEVCKSKYPPLHESKARSSKVIDKWIQCRVVPPDMFR